MLAFLAWTSGIAYALRDPSVRNNYVSLLDECKWQLLGSGSVRFPRKIRVDARESR